MKADPFDIKTVFGFERQLFAPLFQRPYVWKEETQWEPLWEDVRRVTDELLKGNHDCKPHFLGAVVLDQMKVQLGKPDARSIIDGQQRLTTIQLMMEAVRDLCRKSEALELERRRMEKLLENEDVADPEDRFKIWPTNVDRPVYRAIMETHCPETLEAKLQELGPEQRSRLAEAYCYFYSVIQVWLDLDGDPEGGVTRCQALVNAIRDKLRIVVIDMDEQDDAQVIFETLNARGTPLLPSDLVKNFLFHRAQENGLDVETLHRKYWETFDIQDSFWREEIGIGRVRRARIDVYLQHYLALQKRDEVALGELFQEYRAFAGRNVDQGVEWELSSFYRYACHFKTFENQSSDSRGALFFERIGIMQITTVYPLLLMLFEHMKSEQDRLPILMDLESYLVRRMVCRLTTKGYNRLFLDLVAEMAPEGAVSQETLRRYLLKQDSDTSRWPDDEEFQKAWLAEPLYRGISRPRLRILLYALDENIQNSNTEDYTLKKGLTVEHLLPQHWEKHWPLQQRDREGADAFAERKSQRDVLLHTMGNLTLLTKSLNPLVSNGRFKLKKKDILRHSAIKLNQFLHDEEDWDERRIIARGKKLFTKAKKIWPYPSASQ